MKKLEEKCNHEWKYKDIVVAQQFILGEPYNDAIYVIKVCKKCGEVIKEEV